MKKNKLKLKKNGFTLVELLVVISIIGILTIIVSSGFITSREKSRDVSRKSELKSLSDALNMYYSDSGVFPASGTINGLIRDGSEFFDTSSGSRIVYMKKVPENISYQSASDFKSFRLYTTLENEDDSDCLKDSNGNNLNSLDEYTVEEGNCIYVITSSNIGITDVLN